MLKRGCRKPHRELVETANVGTRSCSGLHSLFDGIPVGELNRNRLFLKLFKGKLKDVTHRSLIEKRDAQKCPEVMGNSKLQPFPLLDFV